MDRTGRSKLGIPNVSPLLMPSFSSTFASGTGAAPALNTMYGLTVPAALPEQCAKPCRSATT